MKRILIGLLAALTVFSAASCAQSEEIAPSVTEPTVETAPVEITRYTEAERLVKGKTTAVTRDALAVPLSRKYMLSAELTVEKHSGGVKYGLCAAVNPHGQVLDFYCVSGSDIASYASLYGKEQRADLGQIQTAVASPTDKLTMAIIRDGDLFYLIINGEVMQIREFICDATEPGIYVTNATIRYTAIDYTDDASAVDEAIAEYMGKVKGYGIADGYAQLGGIEMIDEGSFTYTDKLMRKGIEQSRIAFAGAYGGDMEISFKTEGLKALATADNSGDAMCRLRFLLYSDNDVINMICLGVANKQDCIETYGHYDIAQWISHGDLTGNASTYFDWGAVNEFRIVLTSTGRTNTFSVYVNGALAAARTVLGSGDVRFGFEAENVSGTVRDFKVSGGEMR